MFVFCVCYYLFEKTVTDTVSYSRTVALPYCNISYIDQIHRHFLFFPSTFLVLHFALWQCCLVTSEEDEGKRNPHLPRTMLVLCLCLVSPSPPTNLSSLHILVGSEFHSRHLRSPRCFLPYKTLPYLFPQSPHFHFSPVQKPCQWISRFFPHPTTGLHSSSSSASILLLTHSFYPPFALKVLSTSPMLLIFILSQIGYKSHHQELRTGRILVFKEGGSWQESSSFHISSHRDRCFGSLKLELWTYYPIKMLL